VKYVTPPAPRDVGGVRLVHIVDESKPNRTHCNKPHALWKRTTASEFETRKCTNCSKRYAYKKANGLL
jgi:hypothetical protein